MLQHMRPLYTTQGRKASETGSPGEFLIFLYDSPCARLPCNHTLQAVRNTAGGGGCHHAIDHITICRQLPSPHSPTHPGLTRIRHARGWSRSSAARLLLLQIACRMGTRANCQQDCQYPCVAEHRQPP